MIVEEKKEDGTMSYVAVTGGPENPKRHAFPSLTIAQDYIGFPIEIRLATHWLHFVRLALDTAARETELLRAEWGEFDLDRRIWVIPAGHSRYDWERYVPLTEDARDTLEIMKSIADPANPRVFHLLTRGTCLNVVYFIRSTRSVGISCENFLALRKLAKARMKSRSDERASKGDDGEVVDRHMIPTGN